MMNSNASSFNKKHFMTKPPLFDGEMFTIWKTRTKISFDSVEFELWNYILVGPFFHTHFFNN